MKYKVAFIGFATGLAGAFVGMLMFFGVYSKSLEQKLSMILLWIITQIIKIVI
jgi:hypothetical protein